MIVSVRRAGRTALTVSLLAIATVIGVHVGNGAPQVSPVGGPAAVIGVSTSTRGG